MRVSRHSQRYAAQDGDAYIDRQVGADAKAVLNDVFRDRFFDHFGRGGDGQPGAKADEGSATADEIVFLNDAYQ